MKKTLVLLFAFVAFVAVQSNAQAKLLSNAYGTTIATDTITDTGTGYVQAEVSNFKGNVSSVVWNATKINGTVAGTIALHGSNDGVVFASISATTFTATNTASQNGSWQLTGVPFRYIRVTWTGSGTMNATLKATFFANQATR